MIKGSPSSAVTPCREARDPWWPAADGGPLLRVARYPRRPAIPGGPLPPVTRYSWWSRTSGLPTSFAGSASGLGMYLSIQPPSQLAM